MKYKLFLINALIFCISLASVQANDNMQSFVKIETPNVASFTKFIEHSANLYNGNPDVNIPIYTLKDGNVEIPLTLRYNTSGIKVSEEASWVGLGWNLNVGGIIVQNCVAKEDVPSRINTDLNYYPPGTFGYYSGITYRTGDKDIHSSFFFYGNEGHLEPDVFSFSYPGYSGKFFIDHRDNTIHQISKEKPIKINKAEGSTWIITTETGIQHIFKLANKSYFPGSAIPCTITYYLTGSTYPNGGDVTYNYEASTIYSHLHTENQVLPVTHAEGTGAAFYPIIGPVYDNIVIKANEPVLKSIETNNYKIDFISSYREDLLNGKKLDEIKITATNSSWNATPKRFKLLYDYFVSPITENYWSAFSPEYRFDIEYAKRRLKLLSVHEVIGTSITHNRHSFDYYTSPELPIKTSYAVDYWGYYNGKTSNNNMFPDFNYLLWDKDVLGLGKKQMRKANRSYHFASCQAGMLKKVHYPTGGYSVFSFEPNQFKSDQYIPTQEEITAFEESKSNLWFNVVDRNSGTADVIYKQFSITEKTRMSFRVLLSKGLNSWADMQGSSYIIMTTSNKIIKHEVIVLSQLNHLSTIIKEFELELEPDTYRFQVSIPNEIGDQNGAFLNHGSIYGYAYKLIIPKNPGYSTGAGLRISTIDFFEASSATIPTYSVAYEYPNPALNGILYVPPYFHRLYSNLSYVVCRKNYFDDPYYEGDFPLFESIFYVDGQQEVEISGNNLVSAPYSSIGGIVGYSTVREKIANNANCGYKEYNFYNNEETNSRSSVQIPNPLNGKPRSILSYNQEGVLLESETYSYQGTRKHHYRGVTLIDNFNRTPQFYSSSSQDVIERHPSAPLLDFGDFDGRYTILLYAINSEEIRLKSKVTMKDGANITETYQYNTHGLLSETTTTQSDGKSNVTQITYPADYICDIFNVMQIKNMIAFPVEERNIIDGNLSGGKLIQYKAQTTDVVPSSISQVVIPTSGNPAGFFCSGVDASVYPQQNMKITHYDARSNPIAVLRDNIENTVYIWGYNYQYPVAKIENATYENVKSALGGVGPETLSSAATPNMSLINGLRNNLRSALVTTYTYKPLLGITSVTAPNGEVKTFEYDSYGRLLQIKDHNGKTVEEYQYNIRF